MKLSFHGAARTTTGSMYLMEINGKRLLLECGLYQGRRDESIERNCCFPFDPRSVDAVILSHAHIDHCGNLPNLCRQGFEGNIYCTFATRDLASVMLMDSAEIQRSDAEFVSKQRARRGLPAVSPLYTAQDAEKAVRQFVGLNYGRPMPVLDGVSVTFRDAGHILGSAQVVLDIQDGSRRFRYLFTGDIGRGRDEILRDPEPVENVDFLQIESTYGAREHGDRSKAFEKIGELLRTAITRKGKVIIPAFSVGRTQEIVYVIHQLSLAGKLPPVPVFVDSPLSVNATEIHRLHPECFNDSTLQFMKDRANPFGFESITYIRELAHSKKLNDLKDPAIIISASGMCEAGRVRHHLKNHAGDPANLLLFIGYCADHTLGAQILSGQTRVNIFGEPVEIRAQVASLDSFSGHADRSELIEHVHRISGTIKRVSVIHGEESQSLAFAETLRGLLPQSDVFVPSLHQTVEF